ncbi:MAG: DNA polymerase I [Candidatus Latescibacterota bacterium]
MAKRLFLVDGMGIAYRAFYAFVNSPLINSKGENTGAVFGFANTLFKVLRDHSPDYVAIAFDTSAPTFRHRRHAQYKATRDKMPDEMTPQVGRIRQLAAALRIPVLELEGFEADDIMGTLARRAAAQGLEVVILTGDKDLMQLVGPGICLLNPRRAGEDYEWIDAEGVRARLGVGPEQVIDLLGLMGDTSDNVPGVPGIGPKRAAQLIEECGALEAALQQAPQMKPSKVRENLVAFADQARLSRELVTIHTDCPVELDLEAMAVSGFDEPVLAALLQDLEFHRLLEQLALPAVPAAGPQDAAAAPAPAVEYELVTTVGRLQQIAAHLLALGRFAFDLETTSLNPRQARIVGISLAWEAGKAAYVPVGHAQEPNLPLEQAVSCLRPLLGNPGIAKSGQNLKFDTAILVQHGLDPQGIDFDAMVADYLLDPGDRQHNLDALARRHLGYRMQGIEELIGKGKDQITFDQVAQDKACFYSCEDADIALRLEEVLRPRLQADGLGELFARVEMPLVGVLRDVEMAGVAVDVAFLGQFSQQLSVALEELKGRIYETAGQEFNLNSTQQLANVLFNVLGLRTRRKTKTGFSTDSSVLEELAQEHPLPALLLDYRELAKLKSTYVDALPALVDESTGRIHASFNQTVTATGRLSSSDPNLQNVPVRTPLGREIRKAFVPGRAEAVILSADYSQIELRLLAHLSGDEALIAAFQSGEDIHTRTACLLFGLAPEYITPPMRGQAKTVNFAVIYGQTPFGLSRQLGIPQSRARDFIEQYFAAYAQVRRFTLETIDRARHQGYVTTLLGRRRYLPEIESRNVRRREFAERTAVNTPIQGSQADMIKLAMVAIHRELRRRRLDAAMILQVHDELVFEVGKSDLEEVTDLVRREMVGALELRVPVVVECGTGANWFQAH